MGQNTGTACLEGSRPGIINGKHQREDIDGAYSELVFAVPSMDEATIQPSSSSRCFENPLVKSCEPVGKLTPSCQSALCGFATKHSCGPCDSDEFAKGNQELMRAARDGDCASVWQAIQDGADLETRNYRLQFVSRRAGNQLDSSVGLTPLMHAAREGHTDCVRLLLLAKACLLQEDEEGMSPLHHAASCASLDTAGVLMWAGAFPKAVDKSGISVIGHLPPEVLDDVDELRRWHATLAEPLHGKHPIDAQHARPPAEPPTREWSIERVDSLEYTRQALEIMVREQPQVVRAV